MQMRDELNVKGEISHRSMNRLVHPYQMGIAAQCAIKKGEELADKPGSVVDSHSSGTALTRRLVQPTRRLRRAAGVPKNASAYLALLRMGFARRDGYPPDRALLPHDFTLT